MLTHCAAAGSRAHAACSSSRAVQARHSYTAEDIVFDHSFLPCMTAAPDGQARLDWDLFHKTKESPFNTAQIIGGAHS